MRLKTGVRTEKVENVVILRRSDGWKEFIKKRGRGNSAIDDKDVESNDKDEWRDDSRSHPLTPNDMECL